MTLLVVIGDVGIKDGGLSTSALTSISISSFSLYSDESGLHGSDLDDSWIVNEDKSSVPTFNSEMISHQIWPPENKKTVLTDTDKALSLLVTIYFCSSFCG